MLLLHVSEYCTCVLLVFIYIMVYFHSTNIVHMTPPQLMFTLQIQIINTKYNQQ